MIFSEMLPLRAVWDLLGGLFERDRIDRRDPIVLVEFARCFDLLGLWCSTTSFVVSPTADLGDVGSSGLRPDLPDLPDFQDMRSPVGAVP